MIRRLAIMIWGVAIGPVLGDGVGDAKKLVRESKKDEVDVMKVLDLVTNDLQEEGVAEVIAWVIDNGYAEERKRVGEVIGSVPKNDQLMLKFVRVLGFFGEKEQLETAIGKLEKGSVQQEAKFRLALLLAEDAERNLTLTGQERMAINQEATALLEKLGKEDGLNDTLKKWVTNLSYKLGHLVVGCEAPEIEGADHTGKKFRLSEYRGKVVLLPFWGMW